MEACRLCPYAFFCRGGCAAKAKVAHGDYFREFCGDNKEIFDFVASRIIGRKWTETGNDELTLSLAEPVSRITAAERETVMKTRSQKEMYDIAQAAGLFMDECTSENEEKKD